MRWIDMHCDTLSLAEKLGETNCLVDLQRLKKAGVLVQFFACFVDAAGYGKTEKYETWERAYERVCFLAQCAGKEVNSGFHLTPELTQINQCKMGDVCGILTLEEGGVLNGKIDRLDEMYRLGVRLVTLTWNYDNCIGSPNSKNAEVMNRGLKPFGIEVVDRMNRLGMLIDVSHLSDGGFWDCIHYSRKPVVASHSNSRELCHHPRNLSDDMLRALGENGGVAGVNFYSLFLCRQLGKERKACLNDVVGHLRHICEKAGEDAVCLGTDLDGFESEFLPVEIRDVCDVNLLWEEMKKAGFTERQIEKAAFGNVLRVLNEVCG